MDFDLRSKQVPAVLPSFPPMPKPEDFGVDWEDKKIGDMPDSFSGSRELIRRGISRGDALARQNKFNAQMAAYSQALKVWQEQVDKISKAIRTNT